MQVTINDALNTKSGGTSISFSIQFVSATSEVQAVVLTRLQGDIYSIQCIYLAGSDASGCFYVLVTGVEGVQNITGSIDRNSFGLVTNIGCYREVLAYVNTLPIRARIDERCHVTTGEQCL